MLFIDNFLFIVYILCVVVVLLIFVVFFWRGISLFRWILFLVIFIFFNFLIRFFWNINGGELIVDWYRGWCCRICFICLVFFGLGVIVVWIGLDFLVGFFDKVGFENLDRLNNL